MYMRAHSYHLTPQICIADFFSLTAHWLSLTFPSYYKFPSLYSLLLCPSYLSVINLITHSQNDVPYAISYFGTQEVGQFSSPFQSKFTQCRIIFQERDRERKKETEREGDRDRHTERDTEREGGKGTDFKNWRFKQRAM